MKTIKIGKRLVGEGQPCFIIAEAGINHNGQLKLAKELVDVAVIARADAVKFQKRNVKRILTGEGLCKPYLGYNSFGPTYGEHKRALELSKSDYRALKEYCDERDIIFLTSAWDEESVDFLEELNVPAHKIASADLTNLPLLEHVANKGKPIILSTGMSNMGEIEEAVNMIKKYNDELILLQCTSTYPSEIRDINLRVMKTLRDRFNVPGGYSNHVSGIAILVASVALGAAVVETHFTIDRTMKGPDHAASLEPYGLTKMIRDIRDFEKALGSDKKRLLDVEIPIREKLAKSLVSKVNIKKGTVITKDMLTTKGPGTGLAPKYYYKIVGKKAARDIKEDTLIKKEDIRAVK
ncbi:MAG: N-acetylneuraminate synthase family protein [Nanoarchaeota archaeon]|nr:N-acetylneuraminate synthase family protein [Nanoarchaeota archaeon]